MRLFEEFKNGNQFDIISLYAVSNTKGKRRLQPCCLRDQSAKSVANPSERLKNSCSINRLCTEKTNVIDVIPVDLNILAWNK